MSEQTEKNVLQVLTQEDCPKCFVVKNILESEGIAYKEMPITEEQRDFYREKGAMSMPIVVKDELFVAGLEPEKIKELAG